MQFFRKVGRFKVCILRFLVRKIKVELFHFRAIHADILIISIVFVFFIFPIYI